MQSVPTQTPISVPARTSESVPSAHDTRLVAKSLSRLFPTRFLRHYVYWKVRTDPLYPTVSGILAEAGHHPLIDLGCGPGLFAFYLKTCGHLAPIHGLDVDGEKILAAGRIAAEYWPDVSFSEGDFDLWQSNGHQGHVTLLDVLQYLSHERQATLLRQAAACLTDPGHRLIIRNGLADESWRSTVTRVTDHLARWVRWMVSSPTQHPSRARLEQTLTEAGLRTEFKPLWGATPFNNYLVVARR